MYTIDLNKIKVSKSNVISCEIFNGQKFHIHNYITEAWEDKNYNILTGAFTIYCFWVNETEIFIRDGNHEKASFLTSHGNMFKKKGDILNIFLNNELKPIYEKGYVNVMVGLDINEKNKSALYITRGDSKNAISKTSLATIKSLADKTNFKVYKYTDPSGSGIVKSLDDDWGYTKDGVFTTYEDSGDLNKVAIYDPT